MADDDCQDFPRLLPRHVVVVAESAGFFATSDVSINDKRVRDWARELII